jgi:hypothetical protein
MAVNQVGDGGVDGITLAVSGSKVGFYGTTAVVQAAAPGSILSTSAVVSGGYGYSTTQATAIITTLNAIRAALVACGIVAGP